MHLSPALKKRRFNGKLDESADRFVHLDLTFNSTDSTNLNSTLLNTTANTDIDHSFVSTVNKKRAYKDISQSSWNYVAKDCELDIMQKLGLAPRQIENVEELEARLNRKFKKPIR